MGHKTYFIFLYWSVCNILLSDKYRVIIVSENYKYTSCSWWATPKMHREMHVSLYVTDCNQNWNDLKNFNKNSPMSNWICSAVLHLLQADCKANWCVLLLRTHQTGNKKSSEIFLLELQNKNRNKGVSQYPNSKL